MIPKIEARRFIIIHAAQNNEMKRSKCSRELPRFLDRSMKVMYYKGSKNLWNCKM